MNEAVKGYWNNRCNSKAMARAAARAIKEIYADGQIKEKGKTKNEETLPRTQGNKRFILISASDFWGEDQWLRYKEERMKNEIPKDGAGVN